MIFTQYLIKKSHLKVAFYAWKLEWYFIILRLYNIIQIAEIQHIYMIEKSELIFQAGLIFSYSWACISTDDSKTEEKDSARGEIQFRFRIETQLHTKQLYHVLSRGPCYTEGKPNWSIAKVPQAYIIFYTHTVRQLSKRWVLAFKIEAFRTNKRVYYLLTTAEWPGNEVADSLVYWTISIGKISKIFNEIV